jgi:sulfotransferase
MTKKYFFISGFPRSGSTVLSAILIQNPKIYSGISTNLYNLCDLILKNTESSGVQTLSYQQALNVTRGLIESYHADKNAEIIFDTNRSWPNSIGLLKNIFSETKIVCCVRDLPSILNSYERHYQNKSAVIPSYFTPNKEVVNNPYDRIQNLFQFQIAPNYDRCRYLYETEAWKDNIIFVDYDELIQTPEKCIENLYENLKLEHFKHDFNNLNMTFDEIDLVNNNNELHTVTGKLERKNDKWFIPQSLIELYNRECFWRN